ncbi:MAG: hypothetical protein KDD28_15240 [Phaeodactylibacter sp.]|nr:hypothetical protein [Phaeodactylibacter sp.]
MSNTLTSIVYEKDCMVGLQWFPNSFFDLAICDVPYGIGVGNMAYLQATGKSVIQKNGSRLKVNIRQPFRAKEWDETSPGQDYFDELRRVSKHQIVFGVEYVKFDGLGAGRIKWTKGVPEGVSFKGYEMAYCSLIDYEVEIPLLWSGMLQAKNLSEPMTPRGNKKLNEKRIHPCHKPVLLYRKLIRDFGFKGANILDTHVGGGSSRIAAYKEGCHFIGYEIDHEYWEAQEKRFRQLTSQLQFF